MKLSTKCRYGLRAVVEIARYYQKGHAKRKDIASGQDISDSYLENILLVLKSNRIIEAQRGANGGYVLCRAPSDITVLEIVTALEGPLNLVECVNDMDKCQRTADCTTRCVWKELTDSWNKILTSITLQDLIDRNGKGDSFSI